MSSPVPSPAAIAEAALHLQAGKYFLVGGYVMLLYDHLITFSDEVSGVWKRSFSGVTVLFALNRYITPLQVAIFIAAFTSTAWSANKSACDHFYRFEGGSALAMTAICEMIMILRVYALWGRNNRVLAFLGVLWAAQVILSAVVDGRGSRVNLPPGFAGCIQTGGGALYSSFWWMPAVTDTAVFVLTIWRTGFRHSSVPVMERFRRDGLLYFVCIFAVNIINVIFLVAATADLKAIAASFSLLMTSVMVSRLILNIRGLQSSEAVTLSGINSPRDFASTLIGNLGEAISSDSSDSSDSSADHPVHHHHNKH